MNFVSCAACCERKLRQDIAKGYRKPIRVGVVREDGTFRKWPSWDGKVVQ